MEAIGQLSGGIAHDFNNLLTIITGNHELLEMELRDAEHLDLLARANNAALMGARLTNRLLTFARRRRLEPVALDLNEQVLGMAELLRRTLGETIALGTLLAPRLWPVAGRSERGRECRAQSRHQLARRHAGRRQARDRDRQRRARGERCGKRGRGQARRIRAPFGLRHRLGHEQGGAGPRVRALLHHQGARQGHGPGLERDLRLRQAVGRPRDGLQRGRPGHDGQSVPAAHRDGAGAGVEPQAADARHAAHGRDDPARGG